MADGHFFVSYSRRQFYFAEQLVLMLQEAGVPMWFDVQELAPGEQWRDEIERGLNEARGLILVVSRASMESKYVRQEWEPMIAAGKPIYLVIFEACDLPPELEQNMAGVVDVRGRFRPNINRLIPVLKGEGEAPQAKIPRPNRWHFPVRVPFTVGFVTSMMLLFGLFLGLVVWVGLQDTLNILQGNTDGTVYVGIVVVFVMWGYYIFNTLRDFLQRQFTHRQVWLAISSTALLALVFPPLLIFPLLTLFVYFRSAGTYRWLPTGQAPHWMRKRFGVAAAPSLREMQETLDQMEMPQSQQYTISFVPEDTWIADQIESVLKDGGHQRVGHEVDADQHIIVMSNHTPIEMVQYLLKRHPDTLTPIIASNIKPRDGVDGIGDFQFIDFRQHTTEQLEAISMFFRHPEQAKIVYGMNITPISTDIPLFPRGVMTFNLINHLSFLFMTFLTVIIGAVVLSDVPEIETGLLIAFMSFLGLWVVQMMLHLWLAQSVQTRSITFRGYRRRVILIGVISALTFTFAVPALVMYFFSRKAMRHWLPQSIKQADESPRLRQSAERAAIRQGLRDGLIVALVGVAVTAETVIADLLTNIP